MGVGVGDPLGMEMGFWVRPPSVERRVLVLPLAMGGRTMAMVVTPALLLAMAMGTGLEVDMSCQLERGINIENWEELGTYSVALTTCTVYLT